MVGRSDVLFVIEDTEQSGAPLTGEFARYSMGRGWTVLAPPPRMQQAAMGLADGTIALAGIDCAASFSLRSRRRRRELLRRVGRQVDAADDVSSGGGRHR